MVVVESTQLRLGVKPSDATKITSLLTFYFFWQSEFYFSGSRESRRWRETKSASSVLAMWNTSTLFFPPSIDLFKNPNVESRVSLQLRIGQIFLLPSLAGVRSVRVSDSVDGKWHWGDAALFSLWSINIAALGTYLFWPEEVGDARVAYVIEFVPSAALSGGSGWRLWISDAPLPVAAFFITLFVCSWSGRRSGSLSSSAWNFSEHRRLLLLLLAAGESMQLSDQRGWSGGEWKGQSWTTSSTCKFMDLVLTSSCLIIDYASGA